MTNQYNWLPELVLLVNHSGRKEFLEAVYKFFRIDFIENTVMCKTYPVKIQRGRMDSGWEDTFWHLITEGNGTRIIKDNRCERIRWPRKVIDHLLHQDVVSWEKHYKSRGKSEMRLKLVLSDFSYIVILGEQKDYYIIRAAYPIDRKHTYKKLRNDYKKCKKNQ